jgi:hypothetical protein
MNENVANIVAVYRRASHDELVDGLEWYPNAHVIATQLGNGDTRFGAALLAVLSPLQKWDKNVDYAYHAVEYGWPYPGMTDKMNKVIRLLEGENPDTVVKGEKVTSFYNNILDPYGPHVTIDRHAYDIAMGIRHTDETRPSIGKKVYETLSRAYIDAAEELGIAPLSLQAITWVVWRREHGIK